MKNRWVKVCTVWPNKCVNLWIDANLIEIVSGVAPGDRVVDKGAGFLKDGDHVNVVIGDADRPS